jgi:hypothetical protein
MLWIWGFHEILYGVSSEGDMMDTLSDTYITAVYHYHRIPLDRKLNNHVSGTYHSLRMVHTGPTLAAHGRTLPGDGMSFARMSNIGHLSMLQMARTTVLLPVPCAPLSRIFYMVKVNERDSGALFQNIQCLALLALMVAHQENIQWYLIWIG